MNHGRNGLLVDIDDAEAIAEAVLRIRGDQALAEAFTASGRRTAEEYANERLDLEWAKLLDGFVAPGPRDRSSHSLGTASSGAPGS